MLYKNPTTGKWQSSENPPLTGGGTYTPNVNQGNLAYAYLNTPSPIVPSTPNTYIPPANPIDPNKPWARAAGTGNLYYSYIPTTTSTTTVTTGAVANQETEDVQITPGYAALNPDTPSYKASVEKYGPKDTTVTDTSTSSPPVKGEEKSSNEYDDLLAKIAVLEELLKKFGTGTDGAYSSSGNAQSTYDAQLKAIEEQRAYAEKLAEQARQESIKNAYVNYDRSLSTFGQNAERLAQMGLSNSGYGDYLNGVAYSSMVGGVQDAHKTADKAIQDAYYNASQLKAEAADTLYERQAAERAEKAQLLASIYSAVQSGDLDANAAKDILSAYEIGNVGSTTGNTAGSTTGNNVFGNIDKIETENKEKAKTEAINALNLEIKGTEDDDGNMYFPDEAAIRSAYGKYVDEETIKKYAEESEKNKSAYLSSQITPQTTDEEIEALEIDENLKTELKNKRNNLIVDEINRGIEKEIASGNADITPNGLIPELEAIKDDISPEKYQEVYFNKAVAYAKGADSQEEFETVIFCIDSFEKKGIMSPENAEIIKEYACYNQVTVLEGNATGKLDGDKYIITMLGEEYKSGFSNPIQNDKTKEMLSNIDYPVGTVAKIKNGHYCIKDENGNWIILLNKTFKQAFDKAAQYYSVSPKTPTFKKSVSSSSVESAYGSIN